MTRDKPFDFTRYRTQRTGTIIRIERTFGPIEIDLDEIFRAGEARDCVLRASARAVPSLPTAPAGPVNGHAPTPHSAPAGVTGGTSGTGGSGASSQPDFAAWWARRAPGCGPA